MKKALHLYISGRVQGVYFRAFVKNEIDQLNQNQQDRISGFVKNLSDGRVEVCFEGEKQRLMQAFRACRQCPPGSHVTKIEEKWGTVKNIYESFEIAY